MRVSRCHSAPVTVLAASVALALLPGSAMAVGNSPTPGATTEIAPLVAAMQDEMRAAGATNSSALAGLTGANWRQRLAPLFHTLPDFQSQRSMTGPLHGTIVAGTMTLPASIDLTGDTTIVARDLVLTGHDLWIHTNGHAIRFYPIAGVMAGATGSAQAAASTTITIHAEGSPGAAGRTGSSGRQGISGFSGRQGADGEITGDGTFMSCTPGQDGEPGGTGSTGGGGQVGGFGSAGGTGGNITFDIPNGSQDRYFFDVLGGTGGPGGPGGSGGTGGTGGAGGDGGQAGGPDCLDGNGGPGGQGGDGGTGGPGGTGGDSGAGGTVIVTYPVGYDPSQISANVSGGEPGSGGLAGKGGSGGFGGPGGTGGQSGFGGFDGAPGSDGATGSGGQTGDQGRTGGNGTVSIHQR